jgi:hypothetical protein
MESYIQLPLYSKLLYIHDTEKCYKLKFESKCCNFEFAQIHGDNIKFPDAAMLWYIMGSQTVMRVPFLVRQLLCSGTRL